MEDVGWYRTQYKQLVQSIGRPEARPFRKKRASFRFGLNRQTRFSGGSSKESKLTQNLDHVILKSGNERPCGDLKSTLAHPQRRDS